MRLASLLSGGKDSVYAAHLTQRDHQLSYMVSMKPENPDSYMFHTVNIDATRLQAEAWGIPYVETKTQGIKEKELEDLKKVDNSDAIDKGVKARVALLEAVKPMLSKEDAEKADSMTDKELRVAAIKSQDKEFEEAERSDDYLSGAFESAVKRFAESDKTKRDEAGKVIGDGSGHEDADDPATAREKMKARRDGTAADKDKK